MLKFLLVRMFILLSLFITLSAADFLKDSPNELKGNSLCYPLLKDSISLKVLEEAEILFSAASYKKALASYLLLHSMENQEDDVTAFLHYRIGSSYFYLKEYERALGHFEHPTFVKACIDAPFYAGMVCAHMNNHLDALKKLENYSLAPTTKFKNESYFELGKIEFNLKNWDLASEYFTNISLHTSHPQLFILSRFYLARLYLHQGKFIQAESSLNEAAPYLEEAGILQYEWAYLNGELYYHWKDYPRAVAWYTLALPTESLQKMSWRADTLSQLGTACLKAAENVFESPTQLTFYLNKAEDMFTTLAAISSDENTFIALAQCHLSKARLLNNPSAYAKAEEILTKFQPLLSRDHQSLLLLLRAQAAPTHSSRDQLYRQLTHEFHQKTTVHTKGWLLRGLNDFTEGQYQLKYNQPAAAAQLFERAIAGLNHAYQLLIDTDKKQAVIALKYQAYAYHLLDTPQDQLASFQLLSYLMKTPDLLEQSTDPDEIAYLKGLTAACLAEYEMDGNYVEEAQESLKHSIATYPQGKFIDRSLLLLGTLYFQSKKYPEAIEIFSTLSLHESCCAEALFWKARSLEEMGSPREAVQSIKKTIYEKYPQSLFAPEAYFTIFSYKDYLHGERQAIKHLHAFSEKFPNSPYLLNVYYLIGLDFKRDRKTPEGKWISKKNLNAAIDAFQQCETAFESLLKEGNLPLAQFSYYNNIFYRATLERALTNRAIAKESEGTKRQIYFEYAEDVLRDLLSKILIDKQIINQTITQLIPKENSLFSYTEESYYWLGKICLEQGKQDEAIHLFNEMLEKYRTAHITKGYFLSKVCYNLGMAALSKQNYHQALHHFFQAEDTAKGKILSTDEKLDLWIQQSHCYQQLKQPEDAILILSKVVNDDTVSSLRIKAMYLRAEGYEMQGRIELARKQLESAAKQEGEWGQKAKQKLGQEYGYR